jgi:hypothetical protein
VRLTSVQLRTSLELGASPSSLISGVAARGLTRLL